MRLNQDVLNPVLQGRIRLAAILAAVLYGLVAGGLIGRALILRHQTGQLAADAIERSSEMKQAQEAITDAKAEQALAKPGSADALTSTQTTIVKLCESRNCSISDFEVAPEVTPYLSSYVKTTSAQGWQQLQVRTNISGKLPDVISVLRGLGEETAPVEVISMEIGRDSDSSLSEGRILARVLLKVLRRAS